MKITWKIFFSTVTVMIVTFSVAGAVFLSAMFRSNYDQAVEKAVDVNQMFSGALGSYLYARTSEDGMPDTESFQREEWQREFASVTERFLRDNTKVSIWKENKKVYSNIMKGMDETVKTETTHKDAIGSRLFKRQGKFYLKTWSTFQVENTEFSVFTYEDMTALFKERDKQVRTYVKIMLCLLFIDGIISYFLARYLVRPLKKITKTAGEIAGGDLERRIVIHSEDEIGEMADKFNAMAESLAGKIKELEDGARRQEEFIGSFAHELKTPLTSIIGYADLLRSNKEKKEINFLCANYIFSEGKRLENLSLRLLDLIVLKKDELKRQNVSATHFLQEVRGVTLPGLSERNIKLEVRAEKAMISLEPDLMKTVLINLIDNARKAIGQNGMIQLKGRCLEAGYEIRVQDNGKGMPQEELVKITEAFYMVDKSRSREQGGAGLGLALCKEIINLHGGELWFESQVGKGTEVIVLLKEGEHSA